MLQTLKIARVIAAVFTVGFIVYLAITAFKPDKDIQSFLDKPSTIDKMKKLKLQINPNKDKESTLVTEAKALANRIDPPPPPIPPKPQVKDQPKVAEKPKPVINRPPPPTPVKTKNFQVLATCKYETAPEKSLALLKIVSEGNKWFRQGETIGHLTIQEVKDGSIVVYQGDQFHEEISVLPDKGNNTKSLLRPDGTPALAESESKGIAPNPMAATRASRSISPTQSRQVGATPSRSAAARKTPIKQTPEEEQKVLQDSIADLKRLISETQKEQGPGTDEQISAYSQLLDALVESQAKLKAEQDAEQPDESTGKKASVQKEPMSDAEALEMLKSLAGKQTVERPKRPVRNRTGELPADADVKPEPGK